MLNVVCVHVAIRRCWCCFESVNGSLL